MFYILQICFTSSITSEKCSEKFIPTSQLAVNSLRKASLPALAPKRKLPSVWKTIRVPINGFKIKVIYNSRVNVKGIDKFLELADRSSDSHHPLKLNDKTYKGMFRKNDIIVINTKIVYWFSATTKQNGRIVKSGGGLLSGVWEIKLNAERSPEYLKIDKNSYVQNSLLAGSTPGVKLFGADAYGGYPNSNVVWGIHNAVDIHEGSKSGKSILSIEKGAYSAVEGVFIEFEGTITNTGKDSGFESPTDSDPRPGIIGKTTYKLIYRIPAYLEEIIQELEIKVLENNFGPISSAVLALYTPGYTPFKMEYATNPEMMPITPELDLSKVSVNKYFRNTCVKEVFFYEILNQQHRGRRLVAQTAPGQGRIACIGAPKNNISFVCAYPNNDYIPKTTYEEYVLEISENQNSKMVSKFNSIYYKLLSSKDKNITLKTNETLLLIMRYKFIDASEAEINQE
jgi:hypothetical protein